MKHIISYDGKKKEKKKQNSLFHLISTVLCYFYN